MENSNRPRIIRAHDIIHVLLHIWSQHIENFLGSCLRFPDHSSPKIRKAESIRFIYIYIYVVLVNDHGFTGQFKQASVIFTLYGFVIIRSTISISCNDDSTRGKVLSKQNACIWMGYMIAINFSLKKQNTLEILEFLFWIFGMISPAPAQRWNCTLKACSSKQAHPTASQQVPKKKSLPFCGCVCFRVFYFSIFLDWYFYEKYTWISKHNMILMFISWYFIEGPLPWSQDHPEDGFRGQDHPTKKTVLKPRSWSVPPSLW